MIIRLLMNEIITRRLWATRCSSSCFPLRRSELNIAAPPRSVWVSRLLWHLDTHSGGVGVKLLYWLNAGTSDALCEAVKPPPPSLSSPPLLKKERINLCRALCHLKSDSSREAGQEGDQRGALQPGDGHSIRGGDQGWGEIGSRWLVIPWRLIPQGPAMRIWYW